MNLQSQVQQQLTNINIHQLLDKCKSKKELYQFLTQDCKAFLPRIQSTNIYFFKQIMRKEKEYINRDQVKVSSVPHIEGLTVEDFIKYASQKQELLRFLPDQRDWVHMDRQWVCDILYTLDQENFQEKINEALRKRKNLIVQMRPEFAQALTSWLNFSRKKQKNLQYFFQMRKDDRLIYLNLLLKEKELDKKFLMLKKKKKNLK